MGPPLILGFVKIADLFYEERTFGHAFRLQETFTMNLRMLSYLAMLSFGLALLLSLLRVSSVISFDAPIHNVTSGWEQESLFAMWKWLNDVAIYTEPRQIPYSISFYNWLFYELYGPLIWAAQLALNLPDDWIPTIGRSITFLGALLGSAIGYLALLALAGGRGKPSGPEKLIAVSYAGLMFFGPLVGFWVFTVRTDIWALMFEALAILIFWRHYGTRPLFSVLACATACYAAWAFKPISVFTAMTMPLWLFLHRDWRRGFLFSAVLGSAYGVTLLIGGDVYITSLFLNGELGFDPQLAVRNTQNFLVKSAPFIAPLGAIVLVSVLRPASYSSLMTDGRFRFALIGAVISLMMMIPGSAKDGAAENYFMVPTLFLGGLAMVAIRKLQEQEELPDRLCSIFQAVVGAGWAANALAVCLVLAGIKGMVSIAPAANYYIEGRKCVQVLPKPTFVEEFYLSLPWINDSRPVIFPAYNYGFQRQMGHAFEKGGIGGLIESGHFKSIMIRTRANRFDGAELSGYSQAGECIGMTIYQRKISD